VTTPASPGPSTPARPFPREDGALRRWFGYGVNVVLFLGLLAWPTRRNRFFATGKLRRLYFIHFRRRHLETAMLGRRGGACRQCGASCRLGYKCFHFDEARRACRVYSHRPTICRVFPIDERDLAERDAVMTESRCGFLFPAGGPNAAAAAAAAKPASVSWKKGKKRRALRAAKAIHE